MNLVARLTWQVPDAAAFARELGERLGVPPRRGGLVADAWLLRLGTAELEVRPWVREGPMDDPRPAGRLMLEPVPDGEPAPVPSDGDPVVLVGLGWSTVELDRAAAELGPWLGPPAGGPERAEPHLGGRAILRAGGGLPGAWTVLLEPSTEGRLAASLARDGEGPCALYLRPVGGLPDGAVLEGPFGREALLASALSGPFVLITEGREPTAATAEAPAPPGTIEP